MEERAKAGDIFTQQLPNGKYMFGRILMDIKTQCFDSGILKKEETELRSYSSSYVVEVYDLISDSPECPENFNVAFPGIAVWDGAFEKDLWKVVGFKKVNPIEIDFQESIYYYDEEINLTRGEIELSGYLDEDDTTETIRELESAAFMQSEVLIEHVFHYLETNDKTELLDYDSRLLSEEARRIIYDALGEDYTKSYYDLAKGEGYDTARFFKTSLPEQSSVGEKKTDPLEEFNRIKWSFIGSRFSTISDLNAFVNKEGFTFSPEPVLIRNKITILCEYVDENDIDHEIKFDLESMNGIDFKADELLFNIHNKLVEELNDNDYHFFEGLTLHEDKNDKPIYSVNLGN